MKLAPSNLVVATLPVQHVPTQAPSLSPPTPEAPRYSRRRRQRRRALHASQYLGASARRADRAVGDPAPPTQPGHHHPDHVHHGERHEARVEGEEPVPHSERVRAERRRHAVLRSPHSPEKTGLISCGGHRQHCRASAGQRRPVVILDDVVARQAAIGQPENAFFASAQHEVAPQDARSGM